MKILTSMLILGLSLFLPLHATENWEELSDPLIDAPSQIVAWQSGLYLVSNQGVRNTLLMSGDQGETWTEVSDFANLRVGVISVHNNNIFVFATSTGTFADPNVTPYVYRSQDGTTWTKVSDFGATNGTWRAAASFGQYLYAYNSSARLIRSDGTGATLTWESLSNPIDASYAIFAFHSFENRLYAFLSAPAGYRLARSSDGQTWESAYGSFSTSYFYNATYATYNSNLYAGGQALGSQLIATDDTSSSPPSWETVSVTNAIYPAPFVVGETLHVGASNGIWRFTSDNEWEQTVVIPNDTGATSATELEDYAFVATNGHVYRQKLGATDANLQPYFPLPLTYGSNDATVLSWVVEMNMKESLTGLTVVNDGTARATTDISRIRVLRYPSLTPVFDLTPQSDGITWSTTGQNYEWDDGDAIFLLTADITANPTDAATCQFRVSDITWGVNESYSYNGDIEAPIAQALVAPSTSQPEQLTELKVGPQPADTSVSFLIDVNGASSIDIKIFDLRANLIAEITNTTATSGRFRTDWDCRNIASDVYIAQVEINDNGNIRKFKQRVYVK